MERWNKFDNLYFSVTKSGIELFKNVFISEITNNIIPLTKSQQKYEDWYHLDDDSRFSEWLGIEIPKREYGNGGVRFISRKYSDVKGEYRSRVGEAKASYKNALNEKRKQLRIKKIFT